MRNDKLNFGVIIRSFVALLPIMLGFPTLAIITCAYNTVMSFVVFGPLTTVATSLCSVCIAMLLGGFSGAGGELTGFVIAIQAVLAAAGCIYGYLIKRKFSFGLYCSTAGILIPQFIYIQNMAADKGMTVAEAIVPSVEEIKIITQQMLVNVPESEMYIGAYELNIASMFAHKITALLIPASFIVSSLVLAYVVIWVVSVQLRKVPAGISHSFSHIKVPRLMAIALIFLIITGIVILFLNGLAVPEIVFGVILNMIVVIGAICMFAGISFVDFFLRKAIRFTALRVLILFGTIVLFPIACLAYVLVGCVDGFADFRNLKNLCDRKGEFNEAEK